MLPSEKTWEHIQSESDTTLKSRCPYYSKCFFYNARRRAATADILVANHHLLFADLAVRSVTGELSEIAVLPKYERVILDEAHNLEDVASRYFGVRTSYHGILRILNRLYRQKDGKQLGHLTFMKARLQYNAGMIPLNVVDELMEKAEMQAIPAVEKIKGLLQETTDRIYNWVTQNQNSSYEEIKLRLSPKVYQNPAWQEALQDLPLLLKEMHTLSDLLYKMSKLLDRIPGNFEKEARSLAVDLKAQAERLLASANSMDEVLLQKDEATIRWLEAREGRFGHILRFCTSPLDIGPIMKQAIFDKFPTVVMTSATLSVAKSFEFFATRTGLNTVKDGNRKSEIILSSPFDYPNQVILGIPTDMPEPNKPGYEEQLSRVLYQAISASAGRAFVLFTSYYLLRKMHKELEPLLEAQGISLLKQGDKNRHVLLNQFKQDVSSVLFGTDSFWEGVDVQGESLIHVIIPRLPFKVPSEPVIEARVEAIERQGGNSFLEYTVPQAVIKFKQGFGRLIRTKRDYGAISILDRRVISKSYGQMFLSSLPDCQVVVGESQEVFQQVASFLRTHKFASNPAWER